MTCPDSTVSRTKSRTRKPKRKVHSAPSTTSSDDTSRGFQATVNRPSAKQRRGRGIGPRRGDTVDDRVEAAGGAEQLNAPHDPQHTGDDKQHPRDSQADGAGAGGAAPLRFDAGDDDLGQVGGRGHAAVVGFDEAQAAAEGQGLVVETLAVLADGEV